MSRAIRINLFRWVLIGIVMLSAFLIGCSSSVQSPSTTSNKGLTGTITESGSTTVQPIAEKLADAFMSVNPGVRVIIQGGGSSVGIKAASDGTVDFGGSSRELTPSDPQMVTHLLARDGIAIIVNPLNPVNNLTKSQVKDIYTGNVANWSQLGGPDKEIHISAREEGSGTRAAFDELIMSKDSRMARRAILQSSNGALMQVVRSDPWAISFVSFGYLNSSVKALAIDGVAATEANARSGEYPVIRPLYFLTRNQPAGLVKAFFDYCASDEAQTIIADEGYVSAK